MNELRKLLKLLEKQSQQNRPFSVISNAFQPLYQL